MLFLILTNNKCKDGDMKVLIFYRKDEQHGPHHNFTPRDNREVNYSMNYMYF